MACQLLFEEVDRLVGQWQSVFNFNQEGELTIFIPEMPPEIPQLDVLVIIVTTAQADPSEKTIGKCHLADDSFDSKTSAVNSLSPLFSTY